MLRMMVFMALPCGVASSIETLSESVCVSDPISNRDRAAR